MKKLSIFITILAIYLMGCKKFERVTAVETLDPVYVTETSVNLKIFVLDVGANANIGIDFGISSPPTNSMEVAKSFQQDDQVSVPLTNLQKGTKYYVRAWAKNGGAKEYSKEINFIAGTIKDIDGNVYKTVTIGTQIWTAENLKTTHYRNGDPIPNVTDNTAWANLTTGAYCWYNNDIGNKPIYGALYNWFTVVDNRNIAPEGWHVPTDAEWTTLTTFLGGESIAGEKMKEAGRTHWTVTNSGVTDPYGFTLLPAGYFSGIFKYIGDYAFLWSSTSTVVGGAFSRQLNYDNGGVSHNKDNTLTGFSVRLVKD